MGDTKRSIYDLLEADIMKSDMSADEKSRRLSCLIKARNKKVNILLVGATGSGKSSTINALFNTSVAEVGVGVDPATKMIEHYELDNLTVWDSPGLGDGMADDDYSNVIIRKLSELDDEGDPVIDLVLVIIDASSKDLGTTYNLINNVVIPTLGTDAKGRVLVGINQADIAMKGKHWDSEKNEPDEVLLRFLKEKARSVEDRIKSVTGVATRPIYYCAGYTDEDGNQCKPYNLTKLLYYIVNSIPAEKRLALVDNINVDDDKWLHDDEDENYTEEIQEKLFESIRFCTNYGANQGGCIGYAILGIPGSAIGEVIGGAVGFIQGLFKTASKKIKKSAATRKKKKDAKEIEQETVQEEADDVQVE